MGVLLVVVLIGVVMFAMSRLFASGAGRTVRPDAVDDAGAEARRWTDRLGAGVTYLNPGDSTAARQALADASERHGAAELAMASARTRTQFAMVTQTALEGLYYIRAARTAIGLDPGPDLPSTPTTTMTSSGPVDVGGQTYYGSPDPGDATPYYYPGGMIGGHSAPGGWYNQPWWKTAAVAGVAGVGGMLLMDSLLDGFGGHGRGPGAFGGGFGGGGFGGGRGQRG